jgi:peptidoglycan/LPS O-acetylase OafA/YrhL
VSAPTFRPDIEGLRAVAVLLVVLSHLLGWPAGGFVGVDVFFVISGFLITGLLVREHERTGSFSLRQFYVRRIRRLLPAAALVLVVTNVAASLLFLAGRAQQTLVDSVWAFGFLANVRFALLGTDYFERTRPPSPVQHYWSLSVEEQFYVVWPWLVLGALLLGVRLGRRRAVLALAVATVLAGSLAWSVAATAASPTTAYFSTPARAWELAVGALLAVGSREVARVAVPVRALLGWLGLAGIVLSALVLGPQTPFPGWAALLPVLSTAAVLASAAPPGSPGGRWGLANPGMRYLGRLSYSLYLWHWPVVVVLAALLPADSLQLRLTAGVLMLALSVASHHLVEEPVRRSSWLDPRPEPRRLPRPLLRHPTRWGTALACLLIVPTVAAASTLRTGDSPASPDLPGLSPVDPAVPAAQTARELRAELLAALERDSWPGEVLDQLGAVADTGAPEWTQDRCLDVGPPNRERCVYGPDGASRTAALLGDSIAVSWLPGLREVLEPRGWQIHVLTLRQCPHAAVTTFTSQRETPNSGCDTHREWALGQVADLQPDLVVLSHGWEPLFKMVDQPSDDPDLSVWDEGVAEVLDRVTPHAGEVAVLAPPPRTGNLQACVTRVSGPQDCTTTVEPEWEVLERAQRPAVERSGARYVDPTPWFCVDGRCPAVVGTTPVHFDGSHLTQAHARRLAPLLADALPLEALPLD